MPYSSKLMPGELVIHDGTPIDMQVTPAGMGRGLDLSLRPRQGTYAYDGVAEPFPSELLVPKSEWEGRIQELEETETGIDHICLKADLPCHDQDGIPYCWIHGPTTAMEIVRLLQNQLMVLLSATSAGAVIKNFRQQGGWGREGLEFIAQRGVVPQDLWPENQIDRKYDTKENWEVALKYKTTEWMELRPRNLEEQVSCLLRGIPYSPGFNWWAHQVCAIRPLWLDNTIAIRHRNSWGMGYGSKGFFTLQGSKMLSDDTVAPRVAMAA